MPTFLSTRMACAARTAVIGLAALVAACKPSTPEQSETLESAYIGSADEEVFDCFHISISEYRCPDTTFSDAPERFALSAVKNAAITFTLEDGRTVTRTLPPNTDAVFFTRGATRTFLSRYYKATAPAKAEELEKLLAPPAAK